MCHTLQSHLIDLTLGISFNRLYVHLLSFPAHLLNLPPPTSETRHEVEQIISAANNRNAIVTLWWQKRSLTQRELEIARSAIGNGGTGPGPSPVVEEDWEGEMGGIESHGWVGGGERKRDRLGSKLRGALNFIGNNSSNNHNNNNSSFHSSPASHDIPKRQRHSIQVLPKSYSSAGLASQATAVKGIRDLEGFSEMRESEGRKKEGYLWCNGQSKSGEAVRGGVWEKCWCEVKHSQLLEV